MRTPKAADPIAHLAPEQFDEIVRELDVIREEILADLGPSDANHIRRVVRVARAASIAGRTLLMFGIDPLSFVLGTA
ncbi:MAG: acyl-CoA desaturase, partial [Alphaproteobacteria bacterium]